MNKALGILAGMLAAAPALADHRQFEVEDRSSFIPSLRLGIDFGARGEAPAVPRNGHGLEVGFSGASGEDTQFRGAGAPSLTFGGQSFVAPTTVNHEFDFRFFEIAYRYRRFFGATQKFGIEARGGLGYAEMDLTMSSGAQRANDRLQSGGLVGGFGIVWKFLPQTSLQSRITVFGSGEQEGVTGAARLEVGVAHALARNLALRAGLTSWGLVSQRDEDDDSSSPNSHLRAGFGGLSLGLDLAF